MDVRSKLSKPKKKTFKKFVSGLASELLLVMRFDNSGIA